MSFSTTAAARQKEMKASMAVVATSTVGVPGGGAWLIGRRLMGDGTDESQSTEAYALP